MKQIQILVTCDACAAWHSTSNSTDVGTVQASASQTLDLCGSHRADLAPLLSLIAEWGATPERGSKRKASSLPVASTSAPEAPAQSSNGASKRGGARARQRRANAQAAAVVAAPLVCPLCASEMANRDSLATHLRAMHQTTGTAVYGGVCPVCNHDGSARGLGTHAMRQHHLDSAAALFALASSQGDPHGVVAARAAALASS
jgi:hypothetical protein